MTSALAGGTEVRPASTGITSITAFAHDRARPRSTKPKRPQPKPLTRAFRDKREGPVEPVHQPASPEPGLERMGEPSSRSKFRSRRLRPVQLAGYVSLSGSLRRSRPVSADVSGGLAGLHPLRPHRPAPASPGSRLWLAGSVAVAPARPAHASRAPIHSVLASAPRSRRSGEPEVGWARDLRGGVIGGG
jgi:hypothetical protein